MKHPLPLFLVAALTAALSLSASAAEPLRIARQGVFSSGGRVTEPVPGDYDAARNWLDPERKGTTAHVDHANTFFQIPAEDAGAPVVFLHGYGQTRTGWQSTPDGRAGWSDYFLRAGHPVFLVDQPRRGAAGATEKIVTDPGDVAGGAFKTGEQAWYTHFRIGRVAPDRYEGSQFPEGAAALEQFFCQMTPNTGNYDEPLFGEVLGAVLADVRRMTGRKVVYVTHSQGGRVGWATPAEDIAAVVAVEPGFAPEPGGERYAKFLAAKVPMLFLFGDNIENGPADIESTAFWKRVLDQCRDFAEHYNADGGDATVVHLPDLGIRGNSHFLFQEKNNAELAAIVEDWLRERGLAAPASQPRKEQPTMADTALSPLDTALAHIGAAVARGEQDKLAAAFAEAFDSGLTLAQAKEIVGQLYAYCGFPRALNAATTLRAVAGSKFEGSNVPGSGTPEPANLGTCDLSNYILGSDSLSIGTTNQTELCGGPVKGPLFDFHPQLDAYLKAHLFGDIFARDTLDWRTRELVTVAALAARPETEPQMKSHVRIANLNGVTPAQTDAILALVRRPADPAALPADWSSIPVGKPNDAYAKYFTGRSFLHPLTTSQVPAFGVTFEPGCRNNWHIHHAETGGGQILICTAGRGYYQEWGKPAVEMTPGVTVNIPAGVKHWHGAAPDGWFQHIALEVPGTGARNEWLEPVDEAAYAAAMRPPAAVYFTHDISSAGLEKAYKALGRPLEGRKVAVKISTGEAGNTHYLKPELIGPLVRSLKGDIVECNTAYGGSRQETPKHRQTIEDHGFNAIAKVVIMDEFDQLEIPCPAGSTHLRQDLIGAAFTNYDGFVVLNHFKGHMMGGFGGALKNLSIGVASTAGKARIHSAGKTDDAGAVWGDLPPQKDFIESMAEAAGAVVNYMGDRAVYVSVMNNLSIDCDCDAHPHPPEMADVGILASLDPVALDKACVDLVYASDPKTSASLRERMETRLGPHILDHAQALGYGTKSYRLVSLDGTEPTSTQHID